MMWGHDIADLYFGYRPVAGHYPDCSRAGTDVWEATRFRYESFNGEVISEVLRFACSGCGAVTFFGFDQDASTESTHAGEIGYGAKPEKVAGLWLHPGPRLWYGEDRGPTAFYVTTGRDRPRQPEDAAGVVGWRLGPRGGIRWTAGVEVTPRGQVSRDSGQQFSSRRAAVAWIAAHTRADGEGALS
jgi:hypothetical protein